MSKETTLTALTSAGLLGLPFFPKDFVPSSQVTVAFPDLAALGNTLTPAQTANPPTITLSNASQDATYAVLCFDPDAPSREDQKFGPWRHWIKGGLQVGKEGELLGTVDAITPWRGPAPGPGTGLHRYLFLVYEETRKEPISQEGLLKSNERVDRRNFDVPAFVANNGLELIGVNFFLCSVPLS